MVSAVESWTGVVANDYLRGLFTASDLKVEYGYAKLAFLRFIGCLAPLPPFLLGKSISLHFLNGLELHLGERFRLLVHQSLLFNVNESLRLLLFSFLKCNVDGVRMTAIKTGLGFLGNSKSAGLAPDHQQ